MIEALFIAAFGIGVLAAPFFILEAIVVNAWKLFTASRRRTVYRHAERVAQETTTTSRVERRREELQAARRRRFEALEQKRRGIAQSREEDAKRKVGLAAQRRRNDARATCECRWSAYAPHVSKLYTRKDFDRFVGTYMTDNHAPEEVEARATQLLAILDDLYAQREQTTTARRFTTLDDVTAWFLCEQSRIAKLPVDEFVREELKAQLNATFSELSHRILEEPQ